MKPASIAHIKESLINLAPKEVLDLCLRLARYKKENKELLSYLLFEAHDVNGYIESAKAEMDNSFEDINPERTYLAKKSLRKILRGVGRHSRLTGSKQAEAELLIHFCHSVKQKGLPLQHSAALANLYNQQIKKIKILVESLHEDLHFDYKKQIEAL